MVGTGTLPYFFYRKMVGGALACLAERCRRHLTFIANQLPARPDSRGVAPANRNVSVFVRIVLINSAMPLASGKWLVAFSINVASLRDALYSDFRAGKSQNEDKCVQKILLRTGTVAYFFYRKIVGGALVVSNLGLKT